MDTVRNMATVPSEDDIALARELFEAWDNGNGVSKGTHVVATHASDRFGKPGKPSSDGPIVGERCCRSLIRV